MDDLQSIGCLGDLLFQARISKDGGPLFANQKTLAKAALGDRTNERSFRSYVNQVLKPGGAPYARPMSKEMRDQTLQAAALRLDSQFDSDDFVAVFDQLYADLKEVPTGVRSAGLDLDEFEIHAAEANSHFIVTHKPAELRATPSSAELRDPLIHRLGLHSDDPAEPDCTYVFCFPNKLVCSLFWMTLCQQIRENFGPTISDQTIEQNIRRVHESGHLTVYACDENFCKSPYILLNAINREDAPSRERLGYALFIHEDDTAKISIARYDSQSLKLLIKHSGAAENAPPDGLCKPIGPPYDLFSTN